MILNRCIVSVIADIQLRGQSHLILKARRSNTTIVLFQF